MRLMDLDVETILELNGRDREKSKEDNTAVWEKIDEDV